VAALRACSYSSPKSIVICSSASASFADGGGGIHYIKL
jgi:hypothetical protein